MDDERDQPTDNTPEAPVASVVLRHPPGRGSQVSPAERLCLDDASQYERRCRRRGEQVWI